MIENTDFYFQWHITNGCNNRCKHCYHADYNMQNELTREQLLQIANQIEDALEKWNFYSSMSVTGGLLLDVMIFGCCLIILRVIASALLIMTFLPMERLLPIRILQL